MSTAAAPPPAAAKTKNRNGNQGRRTGVTVPKNGVIRSAEDMMEDAEALFETAVSPASAESSKENDAAAKEKKELRFSLAESVVDELLVAGSNDTSVSSQHPVRQLVRHSGRASIDTNDLSSVSTAAASVKEPEVQPEEEEEKQPAVGVAEEDEVELARHNESMKHTPDSPGDFPIDNADDPIDDELVPPPPPPPGSDTETEDEDDDNEEGNNSDNPEALKTQLQEDEHENEKASFLDTSQPNEEDDFPTADGDEDDDGDGGDKEGMGFEMGGTVDDDDEVEEQEDEEDPETPESVLEKRRRKAERAEKLAAAAKKKKKKAATASTSNKNKKTKKKAAVAESSDDEDNDDESTPVPKKKKPAAKKKKFNRFATTFSPKGNPLPLTYTQVPVSDLKAASPEDPKLRRSKRARTKPLQYWKGEKYEYGANNFDEDIYDGVVNMPVVVKICKANPTPYKKRKAPSALSKKKAANKKSKKGDDAAAAASREPDEPFDSSKLRTKYEVNDGKVAQLWDERYNDTRGIKVVSYHETMEARDLPLSKSRKKSEGKVVGKAAQSFHMANDENPAFPGYIVGSLLLPPKGIKDAESVGLCAQVFTIVRGQPQSIEVAFGDPENDTPVWQADTAERFLLSQGDNFLVPPGNTYRIQNHSKTTEALMSWTIVRHNRGLAETETP